jgi:hypothetical protein
LRSSKTNAYLDCKIARELMDSSAFQNVVLGWVSFDFYDSNSRLKATHKTQRNKNRPTLSHHCFFPLALNGAAIIMIRVVLREECQMKAKIKFYGSSNSLNMQENYKEFALKLRNKAALERDVANKPSSRAALRNRP